MYKYKIMPISPIEDDADEAADILVAYASAIFTYYDAFRVDLSKA